MTACWSKGKTKQHPYYYCKTHGCVGRSKTIRREIMEGEFGQLLQSLSPSQPLLNTATQLFDQIWQEQVDQ